MTSPIDSNRPRDIGLNDSKKTSAPASSKAQTGGVSGGSESAPQASALNISDRLESVKKAIEDTPEINLPKVEEIKERIARGDYPIDTSRIAEKMVALEKLLG